MLLKIKKELDNCSRPLFFFDDDPDGLSSFLLLYRYKQAGKGIVVKTYPVLDEKFLNSVKDYEPDKIFIVDIPKISENFLKKLSMPVIYIDHHDICQIKQDNLIYFNPHVYDEKDERCVSYWCYKIINIIEDDNRTKINSINITETNISRTNITEKNISKTNITETNIPKTDIIEKDISKTNTAEITEPKKIDKDENITEPPTKDIWIAMVGCVGDWLLPDFKSEFTRQYPKLLSQKVNKPEKALFGSKIGQLTRVFSFILKGQHKEVMSSIKVLTRIEHPDEIMKKTTSQGRFIYKQFEKINQLYQELLKAVKKENIHENILTFFYTEKQWSFTSDLSNELLYKYPDKVIIVCREKSGEFKCSIRSNKHKLPDKIKKALIGLEGYGGGHDYACGTCVKDKDFNVFLERFKSELN
ncbi:DHH family phosphoesterase [Candidatus Woesearchaeota archaeon]|nr:DHH family phosphoesterase [Candidatus Woesearchaeota archaeon]